MSERDDAEIAEELEDEGVLDPADTLSDDDLAFDPLDTGIDAGDKYRGSTRFGTTLAEEREGESLDQLLSEEEPDVGADDEEWTDEEQEEDLDEQLPRAGRLVATDEGGGPDTETDAVAADVGINGGGASAEEAAIHITDDPEFH